MCDRYSRYSLHDLRRDRGTMRTVRLFTDVSLARGPTNRLPSSRPGAPGHRGACVRTARGTGEDRAFRAQAHRTVSSTIRRSASGPCCRECSLHRSRRIRRRVGRAAPLIPRCARVSCAIGRRAAMASAAAGLRAAGAHIWPPAPSALAHQKILKFIPQTDLRIDPRSGHDDRAHHAQPWLHGVRHAVRHGREVPESSPQMVDNYDVSADELSTRSRCATGSSSTTASPCAPPIASRRSNDGSKRDALGQKVAEATELSPYKCAKERVGLPVARSRTSGTTTTFRARAAIVAVEQGRQGTGAKARQASTRGGAAIWSK